MCAFIGYPELLIQDIFSPAFTPIIKYEVIGILIVLAVPPTCGITTMESVAVGFEPILKCTEVGVVDVLKEPIAIATVSAWKAADCSAEFKSSTLPNTC